MKYRKINKVRIGVVAGAILIITTLLIGFAVFLVMQRYSRELISKGLQLSLENRVQILQAEIEEGFDRSLVIATRPLLISKVQQANAEASSGTTHPILSNAAGSVIPAKLTGIAIFGAHGHELERAGYFTRSPALAVPLHLPGRVSLLWDGRLILRTVLDMKQGGRVVGVVKTEIPLPISTNAFIDARHLGKTGELVLCASLDQKMQCFPSLLNPRVMALSFHSRNVNILPMAHALAGEAGVIFARDYRRKEVVAAYAPVGNLGLGMVLKMDDSELFAPLRARSRYVIPLVAGVIIVALLLLHWLLIPLVSRLVRSEAEASQRSAALSREMAEHKQAEAKILQFQHALDNTLDMIFMFAVGTLRCIYVNLGAVLSTGYSREELLKMPFWHLKPHLSESQFRQLITPLLSNERTSLKFETVHRRKDGAEFPVDIVLQLVRESHENSLFVAIIRDITERKNFEAKLQHQATHDMLTGLPNRGRFYEIIAKATIHSRRMEKILAIMFLDLDDFKNINDTLGHDVGDLILREIARRLIATVRKDDLVGHDNDLVARQGGDEFTIMLQDISHVQEITHVAERILAAVSVPLTARGQEIHVTASIGITVFPFDDTDIAHLLQNADAAMYRAKENGRNKFEFYTAAMNVFIRERMDIEYGLYHALENDELVLYYQPQVDLRTGDIIGVEALLRWVHPEKGVIEPGKFIPIAEESGLIVSIGEWVLRSACRQSKVWQETGFPPIKVAVNLSGRQFRDPNLITVVTKALADANFDWRPGILELEVTESMVMKDIEETIGTLNKLHEMGLYVSIDDFGTGYSSLSYLKRFPINTLKIDQSFIKDITTDPDDANITATIIALGHNLNMNVIAEGVETVEQLTFLREIKCDQIQGYYFSKPLPVHEMEILLRGKRFPV